jgi:hypothetical protein
MNLIEDKLMKQMLLTVGISFVLSRLMVGNLFFIIPLMVQAPKFSDRKVSLFSVGLVALLVLSTELIRSKGALSSTEGRLLLLIGMFIPTVLLVAAAVWIALDDWRTVHRYLASCIFGVVASLAVVIYFSKPSEALLRVDAAMLRTFQVVLGQTTQGAQGTSVGDFESLYRVSLMAMGALLSPLCMILIGFNTFLALSFQGRYDSTFSYRVSRWKVPEETLWVFLGGWTIVLLLLIGRSGYLPRAMALQVALGSSVIYAVQGISIVLHFALRKGIPINTTRFLTTIFLLVFLIPGVNLLVVFALPLLGVTETWIVYRRIE